MRKHTPHSPFPVPHSPSPQYRQLDHTSDIKVEIFGRDLPELFSNAAFCLFDLMLDHSKLSPDERREVRLESPDLSELFLDWLRELLFLFSTHGFAVSRAEVHIRGPGPGVRVPEPEPRIPSPDSPPPAPHSLSALLHGEPYDQDRHGLKLEVKTPTYHEYKLEQTAEGWQATLVLDV